MGGARSEAAAVSQEPGVWLVGAHGSELAGADDNAAHSLYEVPLTLSIAFVVSLALVSGIPPSGALEALDAVTEDGALIYFARDRLTARAMDLARDPSPGRARCKASTSCRPR